MNVKILDDLARRVMEALPQGAHDLKNDVEKNLRATLNSAFTKYNLVTREEFEVQAGVLVRTRAMLQALEAKVAALEVELLKQQPPKPEPKD